MRAEVEMKRVLIGLVVVLAGASIWYQQTHHTAKVTKLAVPTKSLVAMGDSVAAGVGLENDSDSSACDRTDQSYPYVAAKALNYSLHNLGCSKATLPEGILGSQTVNELRLDSQLDQLFAIKAPAVVTITIGANDAGWIQAIGKCYTGTCGSEADTAAVAARLNTVTANLRTAIDKINAHYASSPPVVLVTGYYQVFPATVTAGCSDTVGIDANELGWIRSQISAISEAVKQALPNQPSTRFVQPNFASHELCSKDPWVQGVAQPEPYHPTSEGQRQIAALIETEARSNE